VNDCRLPTADYNYPNLKDVLEHLLNVSLITSTTRGKRRSPEDHDMTTLPFTSVEPAPGAFLLPCAAARARRSTSAAHNKVAGSDEAVAAAQSFSDLSHAVFVPVEPADRPRC
jgi:hypothetical protein